jgi:radical SAM superfamily enzyme YgiQ (UPF0313 family)
LFEDSFNYLSKMCLLRMREAALSMIASARARGIPVLVAGSDATDHPELYLDGGADGVMVGEGEITLVEAVDVLTGRRQMPVGEVSGLCVRGPDGRRQWSSPRPFVRDLDHLPRPAWDLVDIERYRDIWRQHHGYFSLNIATTRGCPYHCNWCAKPIYGQRYTARSPEHVVDEIQWLQQTYRPDHLWIADDIFGLRPGWIEQFASLVEQRHVRTPFKCLLRADGVSESVARSLQAAGCKTAWIGAESGSQSILDAMEKGTRVEQIEDATRYLRRYHIEVGFFLQFGYPGETLDDIERTLAMVRRCRPDDIGISVSYPLPGTRFYERVKAQLGAKQNWVDSADLAAIHQAPYGEEFYRVLHALVHAEFRARNVGRAVTRGSLRAALSALAAATRVPNLRKRLARLARSTPAHQSLRPFLPVLSPQSAAIPSEQPHEA